MAASNYDVSWLLALLCDINLYTCSGGEDSGEDDCSGLSTLGIIGELYSISGGVG